jgi:hypothetical protein
MLKTLEGTLDPDGAIRFREKIRLTRSQRVLVTLLEEDDAAGDEPENGYTRLRVLLAAPEFRDRPYGSAEELENRVEQIRNEWES